MIETFPQLIGYDPEVFEYFKEQYVFIPSSSHGTYLNLRVNLLRSHLCGYDFNLTYPQKSKFPPVGPTKPPTEGGPARAAALASRSPKLIRKNLVAIANGVFNPSTGLVRREKAPEAREIIARERARRAWLEEKRSLRRRDLSGRANGTIDPFYGCFLSEEMEDYALNFTIPWSESLQRCTTWTFNMMDIQAYHKRASFHHWTILDLSMCVARLQIHAAHSLQDASALQCS